MNKRKYRKVKRIVREKKATSDSGASSAGRTQSIHVLVFQ